MDQVRKNKISALSLIVLTTITIAIYFAYSRPAAFADRDIFIPEDVAAIDQIVLKSPSRTVKLNYDGSGWKVNDHHRADQNMVRVLFATLAQNEAKRPVAKFMRDSLSELLEKSGVEVSLYADSTLIKNFLAGGNKTKTQAYFKDLSSGEIFVMVIPGYRVYVAGIYELDESGFRDKRVFTFSWRNFRNLTAIFPARSADNFKVVLDENYFTIEGVNPVDTTRLNQFGDDLAMLSAERILSDEKIADSLSAIVPAMEIIIEDIADRKYDLQLFYNPERKQIMGLKEREVLYFNPQQIRSILRPKSFFVKQ